MSLGGSVAGYLSGSLSRGAASDTLDDDFVGVMGSDAKHLWRVREDLVTLASGNVSTLVSLVGGVNMAQGTAANRPLYVGSGGANGEAYITNATLGDTLRGLTAVISLADGNRHGVYAVVACDSFASEQATFRLTGTGSILYRSNTVNAHQATAHFTGTGNQTVTITNPASDTNWKLVAFRPLATGALCQINGVTTTANFTGSAAFGPYTGASMLRVGFGGGRIAMLLITETAEDAIDTIVRAYVSERYGL